MKTTIVSKEVNEEIDWSKPQWVMSKKGTIVFTNGLNGFNELEDFQGTALPCFPESPNGEFCKIWSKSKFKPIPKDGLTIHIQND